MTKDRADPQKEPGRRPVPKPAEDVRQPDPTAPDEEDHIRIVRQDLEKGRPKDSGREGA